MRWDDFLTENPTFFLSHDKKKRFAKFGKSSHNERFVLNWPIRPKSISFSHTSILCFTLKTIKNEQTTTNPNVTIFLMSGKRSNPCRSDKRKKT